VGKMKRLHIPIVLSLILLTGCSQFDTYLKKLPLINESDQNGSQQVDEKKVDEQTNDQTIADELTLEAGYFNVIEQVAGKSVIQNPKNALALVNKQYALPEG